MSKRKSDITVVKKAKDVEVDKLKDEKVDSKLSEKTEIINKELKKNIDSEKKVFADEGIEERGFKAVDEKHIVGEGVTQADVVLPVRGTEDACCYDFIATEDLVIKPQEKVAFATNVKAKMPKGEVFLINIRSSMGYKNDLAIANTFGIIDADFANNVDNDGNINICLRNLKPNCKIDGVTEMKIYGGLVVEIPNVIDLTEENTVVIKKGERVAQGYFTKFEESENCNSKTKRVGGIGSTGVR